MKVLPAKVEVVEVENEGSFPFSGNKWKFAVMFIFMLVFLLVLIKLV